MKWLTLALLLSLAGCVATPAFAEPRQSLQYRNDLIRYSRVHFGMDAPVALFAGQIHQESAWNHLAKSPYAEGLTQFTPDTAEWIAKLFPVLREADVYNPRWALQAMVLYNKWLHGRIAAEDDCNRWAMVLSSYNGGLGWLLRDKTLAAQAGLNRDLWWRNVELHSTRAAWAFKENRHYPQVIITRHQPLYRRWGGENVICRTMVESGQVSGSGPGHIRVIGLDGPYKRRPQGQS